MASEGTQQDPSPAEAARLFQHPLDGIAMLLQTRARDPDMFSQNRDCVGLSICSVGTNMIINLSPKKN